MLDFDIVLVAPTYLYLYDAGTFPRLRLTQAASIPGVSKTIPFYAGYTTWSRRDSQSEAQPRSSPPVRN